eukprot:gene43755-63515_t
MAPPVCAAVLRRAVLPEDSARVRTRKEGAVPVMLSLFALLVLIIA